MTLRYAHVCETTILAHNGNVSIINTYDSVHFPQLPGQIRKMVFCAGFQVEREDAGRQFEIIARFVDPNGRVLNQLDGEMNVAQDLGELPFHNLGWGLDGQVVQEYGRHELEVRLNGDIVCTIPISVKRAEMAEFHG